MRGDYNLIELSKICTYSKGKKPKILTNGFSQSTPYPYINIKAFEKGIFDQYTDGEKCNLCKEGDLLMVWDGARSGYTGKAKRGAVGSTLMKIEPKQNIKKEYLFYFLLSLYIKLNTNPRGVGIPHVEPRLLWNSKIPLLSLPEQSTIVAKIEQLFSELDNGIANLKNAQEQLKVYRQAILKKAFDGDILTNVSISMTKVSLGDFIEKPKYGTAKKCIPEPIGSPVLRIPNIGNGFVINDNLKFAEFEQKELDGLALKEGDILTIRSNGSVDLVGKSALITKNDIKYLYAGYLIRLRPIKEKLSPKYLLYCLQSQELRVQIESKAKSTSGVNNINSGELESLMISICELEEQHQIIQQIESRLSVCDKVEETIAENLQKAEALRQSILKKAFCGELLTEVEIAACKKEKDWEPAGELLMRIKKD